MLSTELPGRTAPFRIAEIRPRVNGLILKRLFLLPHAAGSEQNTAWRRGLDLARAWQRDGQLKTARWHAVRASRRVQQALMAGPDALYKMEVGERHYVLRGLKGLTTSGAGKGRGAA